MKSSELKDKGINLKKAIKKKIALKIIVSFSVIGLVFLGGAAYFINHWLNLIDLEPLNTDIDNITYPDKYTLNPSAEDPENTITPETIDPSEPSPKETDIFDYIPHAENETGIFNVLILGLDHRKPGEASHSDSMIIATLDRDNNKLKLASLMRDMYVPIPGIKPDNRINTGYLFGGPALAIKTVNQNFNMNLRHYIAIDFFGFEAVIDKIGGVELNITEAEAKIIGMKRFGACVLNGTQALAYARIRKIGDDFERTARQRRVLNALLDKSKTVSIFEIPGILDTLLPYIKTNLSKQQILKLTFQVLTSKASKVDTLRIPLEGTYENKKIRGMDVLVPDLNENTDVLHTFIYNK